MSARKEKPGQGFFRLAHGWRLARSGAAQQLGKSWIRPAISAIPSSIARLFAGCEIHLEGSIDGGDATSRWTLGVSGLEITVSTEDVEPHDVALEVLTCVGQALWDVISPDKCTRWLQMIQCEIDEGVTGDIDEQSLAEKQALFSSAASARSYRRMAEYARTSFAASAAEYVHSLWHDVTVRVGPEHLPPAYLRKRLEMMHHWFPPERGYVLFPEA